MSFDPGLYAWVHDAAAPLGAVTMRKMMGGATLYLGGVAFAIIVEGQLWFKSDAEADALWDQAGCERFSYTFKDGRTATMNYRRAPDEVHDDADAMQRWARLALAAGQRAAAKKRPRQPPPKPGRADSPPRI